MASQDIIALELGGEGARPERLRRRYLWLLRRLVLGAMTLLAVSALVFVATQALPGDPARAVLGRDATPADLAAVHRQLGLDRPLAMQYLHWLGGVLRGDLGKSIVSQESVTSRLGGRIVNSLILVFFAAVISIPVSILLGAQAALRRDRLFDRTTLLVSLALTALPEFVIGLVLVILFSTTVWKLLPAVALIPPGESPFSHLTELVLPVLTLVVAVVPYLYRLVRASMIDVLESEYVHMARLKGVSERVVMLRHALPNALVPAIQGSALVLAWLVGGIVIIEFLFGYPGLGSALIDAVGNRDLPVIQAISLIFAASVIVSNLLADALTIYVTPRLRTAR